MANATYDQRAVIQGVQAQSGGAKVIYTKGIVGTLLGTHASSAAIVNLFKLPANSNIKITGVTAQVSDGGTGAATAPAAAIYQSLAGTGAVSAVATAVWGTRADNAWVTFTVSTTGGVACAAGNVISFGAVAGTVNEAAEIFDNLCIEYIENYSG